MPLIIATVLVKLIRVYHIFNRVQAKIIGKQSSDIFLAGYVLLILLPLIIILIIWTIADPFSSIYRPSPQSGFIQKTCLSKYITIWLFLVVLYMVLLFSVLAIAAIKSRKIRQKNFKDTKKVNIFIFSLFFDINSLTPFILEASWELRHFYTSLHFGYSLLLWTLGDCCAVSASAHRT